MIFTYLLCDRSEVFILTRMTEEETVRKLEMRESCLRFGAVYHAILGAMVLSSSPDKVQDARRVYKEARTDHVKVLERLLEAGAGVNVKDAVGNSPLHYCFYPVWTVGNPTPLTMAGMLLQRGADINAVNRFGVTPLIQCLYDTDIHPDMIEFLLENGADTTISVKYISVELFLAEPKIAKVVKKFEKKRAKKEKKAR